jgi:hypothetical protein
MRFDNATKLYRKSGEAHDSFHSIDQQIQGGAREKQSKHIIFGPGTLWRTWGTHLVSIGLCYDSNSCETGRDSPNSFGECPSSLHVELPEKDDECCCFIWLWLRMRNSP